MLEAVQRTPHDIQRLLCEYAKLNAMKPLPDCLPGNIWGITLFGNGLMLPLDLKSNEGQHSTIQSGCLLCDTLYDQSSSSKTRATLSMPRLSRIRTRHSVSDFASNFYPVIVVE